MKLKLFFSVTSGISLLRFYSKTKSSLHWSVGSDLVQDQSRIIASGLNICMWVQVWGKEENLKDLLSEVATGSLQDGQSPGVYLCEDPICGMQVHVHALSTPQLTTQLDYVRWLLLKQIL